MRGYVPLEHTIPGRPLPNAPSHQHRFLTRLDPNQIESLDYGFGTITTEVLPVDDCFSITYRIFDLKQKQQFSTITSEGGFYMHVRRKGEAQARIENELIIMSEESCGIYYLPPGEIISVIDNQLGVSMIIRIDCMLKRFAGFPLIDKLLKTAQEKPDSLASLPDCKMDFWVLAAVNLLFNMGRSEQLMENAHSLLDQLIKTYINCIDRAQNPALYNALQLNVFTSKSIPTSMLSPGSEQEEQFNDIVEYLLSHLKTNYSRKEISLKSDLTESEFARLFEQGYGKSYSEGYQEIRMAKILDLITQNLKTKEIAQNSGYSSASNLRTEFKKFYGYSTSLFQWPFFINKYRDD